MGFFYLIGWAVTAYITTGATYAYFINEFPNIDSISKRRSDFSFSCFLGIMCLFFYIPFLVVIFSSGFFMYGLQFSGGPKKKYSHCKDIIK